MQARSLVFTIYGDFIIRYGQEIWIGALIRALAEFGIQPATVRMTVSRLVQDGLLQAAPSGTKGHYALTERGRRRLDEGVRRLYRQAPTAWDGQWRVVSFNIADERLRNEVRAELEWRGFGPLGANTWISPHQQEDAVRHLALEYAVHDELHQFTARYRGPTTDQELVARCWDLAAIKAKYAEFIDDVQPCFEKLHAAMSRNGDSITDNRCFIERVWLVHKWRTFLHFDPDLPVSLLPEDWGRAQPLELFWAYYRLLSGGAERYFLDLFHPAPGLVNAAPLPRRRRSGSKEGKDGKISESFGRRRANAARSGW